MEPEGTEPPRERAIATMLERRLLSASMAEVRAAPATRDSKRSFRGAPGMGDMGVVDGFQLMFGQLVFERRLQLLSALAAEVGHHSQQVSAWSTISKHPRLSK